MDFDVSTAEFRFNVAKTQNLPLRRMEGACDCGEVPRRWLAFFTGMLIGTLVLGCSVFGPGMGVSVY